MNWLIIISEGRENHSYSFSAIDRAAAEAESLKLFDRFCFDACREYHKDYLPEVDLYEVSDSGPISINIIEHVKEKLIRDERKRKADMEEQDRRHYEFLKERFDLKPKGGHNEDDPNCNCRSCGRS